MNHAAFFYSVGNGSKIVIRKYHLRRFFCGFGPLILHGDTDIDLLKGRGDDRRQPQQGKTSLSMSEIQ